MICSGLRVYCVVLLLCIVQVKGMTFCHCTDQNKMKGDLLCFTALPFTIYTKFRCNIYLYYDLLRGACVLCCVVVVYCTGKGHGILPHYTVPIKTTGKAT